MTESPKLSIRERLSIRWRVLVHLLEFHENPRIARIGRAVYVVQRTLDGAHRVETSHWNPSDGSMGTEGSIHEGGIDIDFDGACPVQGDGVVDGRPAYYRSRGEGWELCIAKEYGDALDDDAWTYSECRYFFPEGGWVSPLVSEACIRRAVTKWRREGRP